MKKLDNLSDIPKLTYEGYVWFSNKKEPQILDKALFDSVQFEENTFIIEALLWNAEDGGTSIMIRHTGKYHIQVFKLKELPAGHKLEEKAYLPHRLDKVKHVYFQQLWIPEPDAFCEKMEVMTMKALIFTGFNSSTEKH
ncbi:TIGR04423 family type III CRISPR-associated protein [Cellulophaga sp. BC115SP]|uniref:TIGR04423 family type III CRISPR-associated protein n=1 Tax=Cellulophaga sp. BC115SP TaxID=2683263 RepID=UPI0014134092|nr:TIGR04423 family type III CRISPR-associated protein [Cellulophaga sp. BC115SP]NBB31246.1 TIGR04423 family type III CRISPR-associated protein [Cellulophaga sp. BC115SP]